MSAEPLDTVSENLTDPGEPWITDSDIADFETCRIMANLGFGGSVDPGAPEFRVDSEGKRVATTTDIEFDRAQEFLHDCQTSTPRVTYGLGAKVPFSGAVPGRDFTKVDCSGFVREALRRSTKPILAFPDGSVIQHEWVRSRAYAACPLADGSRSDGIVRIAFLRPQDATSRIGHVVLLYKGWTLESHGGVGPDSRPWTGVGWQSKTFMYEFGTKV